jgi:hypothetical protein
MRIITLAILFLSTIAVAAETKVYLGEAIYTKSGWDARSRFNTLEQLGVERHAERNAYKRCIADGARDCVILNDASITNCNTAYDLYSTGCWAEAHARGDVN